jgi:tRNA/rRNA methyltransferase
VLLDRAEFHSDLAAALGPATWVCGTSSRQLPGRPRLSPRQLGEEVTRRAGTGELALVFGEEQRGLSDAELELCHAVCTIPTSSDYDSMNLAQSVAVLCYELACGGGAEASVEKPRPGPGGIPASPPDPARHATVEALWARLKVVLVAAGYLNPQNPELILAEWRRLLTRAEPTQREVELLLAAVRSLERQLAAPPPGP